MHLDDEPQHTVDLGAPGGDGAVLVLGAGWVGSRLANQLHERGYAVHASNRPSTDPSSKDEYFRPVPLPAAVSRHAFDMGDASTWSVLPPPSQLRAVVITFPLTLPPVDEFWSQYLAHVPSVVCYSSTSVYQVDVPGQTIDESNALKQTPRAQAEAFLQERGATVLTIAGIFGEERGPRGVCSCLSAYLGAGGVPNGRKSVNMVHENDIVHATCSCLHSHDEVKGDRINVAGEHFLLRDLVAHCKHPPVPESDAGDLSSKVVSSQRLLEEIMPDGFAFRPPVPVAAPMVGARDAA